MAILIAFNASTILFNFVFADRENSTKGAGRLF